MLETSKNMTAIIIFWEIEGNTLRISYTEEI